MISEISSQDCSPLRTRSLAHELLYSYKPEVGSKQGSCLHEWAVPALSTYLTRKEGRKMYLSMQIPSYLHHLLFGPIQNFVNSDISYQLLPGNNNLSTFVFSKKFIFCFSFCTLSTLTLLLLQVSWVMGQLSYTGHSLFFPQCFCCSPLNFL